MIWDRERIVRTCTNCSVSKLEVSELMICQDSASFIQTIYGFIHFTSLKGKAPNRPILRYSINVSHPCIIIFFIKNIYPEFAKLLDTRPITIHKFYSTGLDGLNETFFSIYLKFIMLCRKSTLYSCFPAV